VNLGGFYLLWPQKLNGNVLNDWCNPKAGLTCLYYNCMSFTEHNSCATTCIDLAQYVVCVMSARVHSDKLSAFYIQIALIFSIPCVCIHFFILCLFIHVNLLVLTSLEHHLYIGCS
jgi:hypothetical protein